MPPLHSSAGEHRLHPARGVAAHNSTTVLRDLLGALGLLDVRESTQDFTNLAVLLPRELAFSVLAGLIGGDGSVEYSAGCRDPGSPYIYSLTQSILSRHKGISSHMGTVVLFQRLAHAVGAGGTPTFCGDKGYGKAKVHASGPSQREQADHVRPFFERKGPEQNQPGRCPQLPNFRAMETVEPEPGGGCLGGFLAELAADAAAASLAGREQPISADVEVATMVILLDKHGKIIPYASVGDDLVSVSCLEQQPTDAEAVLAMGEQLPVNLSLVHHWDSCVPRGLPRPPKFAGTVFICGQRDYGAANQSTYPRAKTDKHPTRHLVGRAVEMAGWEVSEHYRFFYPRSLLPLRPP